METQMTKNGVTTTNAPGQEQYEEYRDFRGRDLVQYDYRHTNGVLFSTVKKSLELCREARDSWMREKGFV